MKVNDSKSQISQNTWKDRLDVLNDMVQTIRAWIARDGHNIELQIINNNLSYRFPEVSEFSTPLNPLFVQQNLPYLSGWTRIYEYLIALQKTKSSVIIGD